MLAIVGEGLVAPVPGADRGGALLLAVLLDAGLAVIVLAMISVLAGVVSGSMELAAYTFLGGLAGTIVIRRGERLALFGQAAVAIGVVNAAVVVAFALIDYPTNDLQAFAQLIGASFVSAAGAAIVAAGTFVLLGNVFGITTSYQLLELANPTQPLLRRLLLEAPGTYHHSLMVGNLAEQAAEAIGADALVTRVAAYYHDVGKLYDPMVFIENQAGGENVHDELPPEESAAMIVGHVARGIDIAYQYKLPKALIPFIPQHHGTALMGYFYAKARQIAAEESRRGPRFRRRPRRPPTRSTSAASAMPGPSRSRARRPSSCWPTAWRPRYARSPATTSRPSARWSRASSATASSMGSSTNATSRCATSTASASRSSSRCWRCITAASPIPPTRSWSWNRGGR